jgi:hypothetical protein
VLLGVLLCAPGSTQAQYVQRTGSENPFDGIRVTSTPAAVDAVMGDFDTDGAPDLLVYDGAAERYYDNDGTGTFVEQTGSDDPFDGVSSAFGTRGRTFVRDVDADGDLDLVTFDYTGGGSGTLVLVENTDASTYARRTGSDNPFDGIQVSGNPATVDAVMGDFSGDGAPDLLVYDGATERYYENEGTGTFTEQAGTDNPFDGLSQAFATKATTLVHDFDRDGDVDLAFRDGSAGAAGWQYREQTSGGFVARSGADNPLRNVAADATAKSVTAATGDFDLDGALELVTFDAGTQRYYDDDGSGTFAEQTGAANPFDGLAPVLQTFATTVGRDLEGDRDLDLTRAEPGADALRYVERVDAAVALTDGRNDANGGTDYSPPAPSPGTDANPIGRFALQTGGVTATLRDVTVTFAGTDVQGVEAVELWASTDDAFDVGTDTPVTGEKGYAGTVSFEDIGASLDDGDRYLFVVVDLGGAASGTPVPLLSSETALAFGGGALQTVNGTATSTFTDAYLSVGSTALPVELASFKGTTTDTGVRLAWTTASEQNNAGFRVVRRAGSADGAGWTAVGFVKSRADGGSSSQSTTYEFIDADVPYAADSLAYRLRQVDTGGTTRTTEAVTVARSGPSGLELLGTYPNPARGHAIVRYGVPASVDGAVHLRLYDVLGRQVRTVRAAADAGRHRRRLDVSGLASGTYILRLAVGGRAVTRTLAIIR